MAVLGHSTSLLVSVLGLIAIRVIGILLLDNVQATIIQRVSITRLLVIMQAAIIHLVSIITSLAKQLDNAIPLAVTTPSLVVMLVDLTQPVTITSLLDYVLV
jgi:hypothetical protein